MPAGLVALGDDDVGARGNMALGVDGPSGQRALATNAGSYDKAMSNCWSARRPENGADGPQSKGESSEGSEGTS